MPRGRIVLKRICESRKLAALKTDGARLLYTWLIPNVDSNGCFSGDPQVIKGKIFTRLRKSIKTIAGYLNELKEANIIILYESNGHIFLCIPDFAEKQPYINADREAKTTIPPPTQEQLKSYSRVTPPQIESKSKRESKIQSKGKGEFPPTSVMVTDYAKEINYQLDGNKFCDYYAARGWKLKGGTLMKDWRAAVRTWKRRDDEAPKPETSLERIKRIRKESENGQRQN